MDRYRDMCKVTWTKIWTGRGVPCLCPCPCPFPCLSLTLCLFSYVPVFFSVLLSLPLCPYVPIPLFLSFNPCPSISAISVPLSPLSLTLSLCPRLIHSVLASLSLLLCSCPCPSLALYYNLYTLL